MTRGEAEAAVGSRVAVRQEDPYVAAVVIDEGTLLGLDGPCAVVDLDDGRTVRCQVSQVRGAESQ